MVAATQQCNREEKIRIRLSKVYATLMGVARPCTIEGLFELHLKKACYRDSYNLPGYI